MSEKPKDSAELVKAIFTLVADNMLSGVDVSPLASALVDEFLGGLWEHHNCPWRETEPRLRETVKALADALRGTAEFRRPQTKAPEPYDCWCAHERLAGEQHSVWCDQALAALQRAEEEELSR